MGLKLTTVSGLDGRRVATRTITVSGPDVPDSHRLRRVAFIDGRWMASPVDTATDLGSGVEAGGDAAVGSTITLDGKRMQVASRPGADPELVDENDNYYGEPSEEPGRIAAAVQQALKDGVAALDQLRNLPRTADAFDAGAAAASAETMVAFCAAVAARKPWAGQVGTAQARNVIEQLDHLAAELQRVAELARSAAEEWEESWEEVSAIVDAARTAAGPDGAPELRFEHFDDEPEPEPEPLTPPANLVSQNYGRSRNSPAVHVGVRESRYSVKARCGAISAYGSFISTDEAVTCGRCLHLSRS
jgi:hypothetical protein